VALVDAEARALVGAWTEPVTCCDAVEPGAVRRFVQAILDEDPDYAPGAQTRFGGPIAPPLFPNHMLRRPLGAPDLVQQRASDPDFDGVVPQPGLPPIACLAHLPVVNGGSEFEFFRYALHGETVTFRQRYAEITEKPSRNGALVVVVIEGEARTGGGELLLRSRRTLLRRAS
jgi:hypothetical protein